MIDVKDFYRKLNENGFCFFAGVPDSLLKEFCLLLEREAGTSHIITANEGNAIGACAGYNIATGKYGVTYMQNSGLGNTVNPLLSLADEKVYKIPMLLIIGYRGEPGVKDEPQHITQGELTLPLLETLRIEYKILDDNYSEQLLFAREYLDKNSKPFALVVRKGTFEKYLIEEPEKENEYNLTRDDAIKTIVKGLGNDDFIVSTTGKASRELFFAREEFGQGQENLHGRDFLTVGSMGHTSSIALGMSLGTNKNIYCIDGDGSFIMHMGGLAVCAQNAGDNFKYILINNGCHESVGGQPTVACKIDIKGILNSFGFRQVFEAYDVKDIEESLALMKDGKAALIIYTNAESSETLGRPTTTPLMNKEAFQKLIRL